MTKCILVSFLHTVFPPLSFYSLLLIRGISYSLGVQRLNSGAGFKESYYCKHRFRSLHYRLLREPGNFAQIDDIQRPFLLASSSVF